MKDIRYLELFDIYSPLLTEKQAEMFEAYYSFDLSLSEIAEDKGVTRQSVADSLKKTRLELDDLERKLQVRSMKSALREFSETLDGKNRKIVSDILDGTEK